MGVYEELGSECYQCVERLDCMIDEVRDIILQLIRADLHVARAIAWNPNEPPMTRRIIQ